VQNQRKSNRPQFNLSAELIHRAQKGEDQAVNAVCAEVYPHLYRYLYFLSGNTALTEDLCQEALIKGIHQLKKLKEISSFQAWMVRIARNLYIDFCRSKQKQEVELDGTELPNGISNAETHSDVIDVRKSLQVLDPDDQSVLILVDLQGMSYFEAAQALEITEEALASRLHRARKEFLKHYENGKRR